MSEHDLRMQMIMGTIKETDRVVAEFRAEAAARKVAEAAAQPCSTCAHRANNLILAIFAPTNQYCNRPNRPMDLVTGQPQKLFAEVERISWSTDRCGRLGQFHSNNKA